MKDVRRGCAGDGRDHGWPLPLEVAYTLSGFGLLQGDNHDQYAGWQNLFSGEAVAESRVELPQYGVVDILICALDVPDWDTACACFSSSCVLYGLVTKELLRAHGF
jgi:hypothetical protein